MPWFLPLGTSSETCSGTTSVTSSESEIGFPYEIPDSDILESRAKAAERKSQENPDFNPSFDSAKLRKTCMDCMVIDVFQTNTGYNFMFIILHYSNCYRFMLLLDSYYWLFMVRS